MPIEVIFFGFLYVIFNIVSLAVFKIFYIEMKIFTRKNGENLFQSGLGRHRKGNVHPYWALGSELIPVYIQSARWRLFKYSDGKLLLYFSPNLLLIYWPREGVGLSWPSQLTSSGRFTHINGHPQLKVERATGKVRRPKTDVLPFCHATKLRQS